MLFADESTPAPLREAYDEIVLSVGSVRGGEQPEALAEVVWASLHGLATLTHDGRLPVRGRETRIRILVAALVD